MAALRALAVLSCMLAPALAELSDVERLFVSIPSPDQAREHLRTITSVPHMAGTPGDLETATFVRDKFLEFGIEAKIEPLKGSCLSVAFASQV